MPLQSYWHLRSTSCRPYTGHRIFILSTLFHHIHCLGTQYCCRSFVYMSSILDLFYVQITLIKILKTFNDSGISCRLGKTSNMYNQPTDNKANSNVEMFYVYGSIFQQGHRLSNQHLNHTQLRIIANIEVIILTDESFSKRTKYTILFPMNTFIK